MESIHTSYGARFVPSLSSGSSGGSGNPAKLVQLRRGSISTLETFDQRNQHRLYHNDHASRGDRDDERDDAMYKSRLEERMEFQRRPDIRKPLASLAKTPQGMPGPIVMHDAGERRPSETTIWRHGTSWYNGVIHHGTRGALHHRVSGSHALPAVGMVPLSQDESDVRRSAPSTSSSVYSSTSMNNTHYLSSGHSPFSRPYPVRSVVHHRQLTSSSRGGRISPTIVRPRVMIAGNIVVPSETPTIVRPRVIIPSNIVIPRGMSPPRASDVKSPVIAPEEGEGIKRSTTDSWHSSPSTTPSTKRARTLFENNHQESSFDKLDLLCSATLELGPLSENPAGCSCPKSKCVALYCDCFKAGRRCSPTACTCLSCKNTIEESGANGARSKAIQSILARNPRAFTNAGNGNPANKLKPGEQACNCIRSHCLKLYCTCFQAGKVCNEFCACVGCLNTAEDSTGKRQLAIQSTLEKRPDAFKEKKKVREVGSGCACKNNRCIRKYCECFRTNLACTKKCSCRDCENHQGEQ